MTALDAKINAKAKAGVFGGLKDILAEGFDQLLATDDHMLRIDVDDIEILAQVREEFEDDENLLVELGESLRLRQLQNIVVRPNPRGGKPYELVIGERRVRAVQAAGQRELWALVATMSDDQAADAQFAENVQRKNLTQVEEAKRIQRDIDHLGSVEAVLRKHNKSQAWLSKRLGLLNLPGQARRLMKENISADIEVIHAVRQIEQRDPVQARGVVEELKAKRGKVNARALVGSVKDQVKPKKQTAAGGGGSVATPRNRSHEEPSQGRVQAVLGARARPAHEEPLARAYQAIFERGQQPKAVLEALTDDEAAAVETFLHTFWEAGKQAADAGRVVIEGFRNGGFATDGVGAFALVAYLHGVDARARFSVLNIFGTVKP